jgi:hypothetical protein
MCSAALAACNAISGVGDFGFDRETGTSTSSSGGAGVGGGGGGGGAGGCLVVDGVCCDAPCDGPCMACDLPSASGSCSPVAVGSDPDDECRGSCNGSGACADASIGGFAILGGAGTAGIAAVGVDAAGNVTLGGKFTGAAVVAGGPTLSSAGGTDAVLVGLDATLAHRWSSRHGGAGADVVSDLVVTDGGEIAAVGDFAASIELAGVNNTVGGSDVWAALLDPSGTPLWDHAGGGMANDKALGVARDGNGDVVTVGYLSAAGNLGGGTIGQNGTQDGFVLRLAGATGAHVSSQSYGDAASDFFQDAAINGMGELSIVGHFDGALDLGGEVLMSEGGLDVAFFRVDATGMSVWARSAGDALQQTMSSAVVAPSGDFVVAGQLRGAVDLGDGVTSGGINGDAFVAKLDRQTGATIWSRRLGDVGEQEANAAAVIPSGEVIVVGCNDGTLTNGLDLTSVSGMDAFVLALTPDGDPLWALQFGGSGRDCANGVDVGSDGTIIVGGEFATSIDFGDGPIMAVGGADGFVVTIEP